MAHNINDRNVGVTDLAKARAAKAKKAKPPAMQVTAESGVTIIESSFVDEERAPGLGHNQPTEGEFLRWVQRLREQDTKIEAAKLVVKDERGKRKDLRLLAQGAGITMGELDDALADLNTDTVDLVAREERRRLYRMWLGLPAGTQGKLPLPTNDTDAEIARWERRGDLDGRLGRAREVPEGCPPDRLQAYFKGWEAGQAALMRGADLTKEAFEKPPAGEAPAPGAKEPKGAAGDGKLTGGVKSKGQAANRSSKDPEPQEGPTLVLDEAAFATGTPLDEANLKTLLEAKREAFDAADRVVALFGTMRRILKEPDPNEEGGFYVDDGEEAAVTDAEPVPAPDAPTAAELA